MKKPILFITGVVAMLLLSTDFIKADDKFSPKLKLNSNKNFDEVIKQRDYEKALKVAGKSGSLFGLTVDLVLGYNSTSANADQTTSLQPVSTTSKGGFSFAALLNVQLFDIINFTTGLDFTKKNFGIEIPYYDSTTTTDSVIQDLSNSYVNIPLNFNFGGMVSDDLGITLSAGPYLGFLLNPESALGGYKDFDFGVNGILTGRYYLNPFVAIVAGGQGQYGGLNNLLSTGSIESMQTFNWGLFAGLSLGI